MTEFGVELESATLCVADFYSSVGLASQLTAPGNSLRMPVASARQTLRDMGKDALRQKVPLS